MARKKREDQEKWHIRRVKLTPEEDAVLGEFSRCICCDKSGVLRYYLSITALYFDEKTKVQIYKNLTNMKNEYKKDECIYMSVRLPKSVTDVYESVLTKGWYRTSDYYHEILKGSLNDMRKLLEKKRVLNLPEYGMDELLEKIYMEGAVGK